MCPKCSSQVNHSMPHRTHIVTAGIAHILFARAIRFAGMIRSRYPRDVRSRSEMRSPSGESEVPSFPRERDGVRERDVWSRMVVHHPSGQRVAASISRERDGVPERDVWTRWIARHPSGESASIRTLSSKSERLILLRSFTNTLAQQAASCNRYPPLCLRRFTLI